MHKNTANQGQYAYTNALKQSFLHTENIISLVRWRTQRSSGTLTGRKEISSIIPLIRPFRLK